jgi:hypothetical protein
MREGWRDMPTREQRRGEDHDGVPDSVSPPASAGREYSPPGPPPGDAQQPAPSTQAESMPDNEHQRERQEPMPSRSFREDLEAERARRAPEPPDEPVPEPRRGGSVSASTFAEDLERARRRRDERELELER